MNHMTWPAALRLFPNRSTNQTQRCQSLTCLTKKQSSFVCWCRLDDNSLWLPAFVELPCDGVLQCLFEPDMTHFLHRLNTCTTAAHPHAAMHYGKAGGATVKTQTDESQREGRIFCFVLCFDVWDKTRIKKDKQYMKSAVKVILTPSLHFLLP